LFSDRDGSQADRVRTFRRDFSETGLQGVRELDTAFNPLDPLGIYRKHADSQAQDLIQTRYDVMGDINKSAGEFSNTFWPPPDPLQIFHRKNRYSPNGTMPHPAPSNPPAASKALSGAVIGNPIPIEWADQVIPLKNQARDKMIAQGYSEKQVDQALHWGEEWLIGMAKRLAPQNPDLQKQVVVAGYADIVPRAEKWIAGIDNFAAAR
jgi:hypothetical protein